MPNSLLFVEKVLKSVLHSLYVIPLLQFSLNPLSLGFNPPAAPELPCEGEQRIPHLTPHLSTYMSVQEPPLPEVSQP